MTTNEILLIRIVHVPAAPISNHRIHDYASGTVRHSPHARIPSQDAPVGEIPHLGWSRMRVLARGSVLEASLEEPRGAGIVEWSMRVSAGTRGSWSRVAPMRRDRAAGAAHVQSWRSPGPCATDEQARDEEWCSRSLHRRSRMDAWSTRPSSGPVFRPSAKAAKRRRSFARGRRCDAAIACLPRGFHH